MFQHGVERAGYIEAPRDPDLAFEFLRPVRRQIRHDGVQYNNRIYNGPGLDGLREHESDYLGKADRRWYIHVNPDDIRRVFFRRPDTRSWHSLYWTSASAFDLPMNEDGVTYARRLAKAGGTSGVLWGAMLSALGTRLGDTGRPDSATVAAGMRDGYDALIRLGGAAPGDKTMLDALLPFVEELERRVADGEPWQPAWSAAADVAIEAARATADLRPKVGRARPLAERSVGTPDDGATSPAMCARTVADCFTLTTKGDD